MDLDSIKGLTTDEKLELLELLELRDRRKRENLLSSYKPYEKQKQFHAAGLDNRERLFMAANQGHPLSFKVLTPNGWVPIGELQVGSPVIAGDGSECHVTGVVDLGEREIYEVSFDNGNIKVPCTDDHLWAVRAPRSQKWRVESTLEVTQRKARPRTPLCGVVLFNDKELPEDPFQVGLRLAADESGDARVPLPYLTAGPRQRLQVLEGLTDKGVLYASSPGLIEDAVFLIRSMGLQARVELMADGTRAIRMVEQDHVWDGVVKTGRVEQARCIRISHPSRLYICEGFIVTHNCGKTLAAAFEIAMHATGRYPDWWQGKRFHRPVSILIGSETAELTRKGLQRLLLGSPQKRDEWGTGAVPKECLGHTSMKAGVPDAVASVTIKNEYGGESVIQFNSYDQGRTRWQADTIDVVAMDEEPPLDIYSEALTRTNVTGGIVFVTFTPLLGMTQVVKRFLLEKPAGTHVTRMTIEDVDHYTPEERAKIVAAYPEHEREARARGIPIMGSGLVFPVAESSITVAPFEIPPHWSRICGIDFGWGHPSAFVCLAHDRETDTAYVYDAWKLKETPIMTQAGMIVGKGYQDLPWAWPHDGLQHDKGSGEILRDQYKKFGINMLPERAQFENLPDGRPGGNSPEAGVAMMLERMQTRRLRVFSHLEDWFSEFRMYHRKEGIIVKDDDDILAATRYGLMMLRKAKSLHDLEPVRRSMMPQAANVPRFEVFDPAVNY